MRTERSWCGEPGWQKGHHSQQHCWGWTVLRRGCGWESCQSCPTLWTPRTTQSMEFSRTEIFCPLEVCLLNLFQARGGEGWAGEKGPGRWAGRGERDSGRGEYLLYQSLKRPRPWGCGFHIAGPFPSPARCFIPKTFQKADSER